MSDWNQLFSEVSDLAAPPRLRERILAAATAAGSQPTPRPRLALAAKWGLAAAATLVVLVGLALAAHSRTGASPSGERPRPSRVVPNVRGTSVLTAITTLQRAGFKVSVPEGLRFGSLTPTPTVGREAPLAGTTLPVGATVTLTDSRYGCCVGSPVGGAERVPDLVGSTAEQAIRELRRMHLPWEIRVRPFFKEQRPLLTTVRVVGQSPAPGLLVVHHGFRVPTMTAAYPAKEPFPRATQVRGMIVTVGGPTSGAPNPISGARIRFLGSGGTAVVVASKDGRFALDMPPGRYKVEIIGHAPMANGTFLAPIPDSVVVRRGGHPLSLVVSIK
jgi:PASTA domain